MVGNAELNTKQLPKNIEQFIEGGKKTRFTRGQIPWSKGAKFTEEHRKNLSESHKGPRLWARKAPQTSKCVECGAIFQHKAKPSQNRQYCSLKCQHKLALRKSHEREYPTGKDNPKWRGGGSEREVAKGRIEYKQWRKAVFERDNYTCQICKERGGKLNADHIKPWMLFPKLRYVIDNGRTLCFDCHKETDTWGGRVFSYGR